MAEVYAKQASIKDARVQELAFEANPALSKEVLTEKESGVICKFCEEDVIKPIKDGGIKPIKEIEPEEYATLGLEYEAIKNDATKTSDERAAAAILEGITKTALARLAQKTKFSSSFVHFISALSIRLYPKDPEAVEIIDKTTVIKDKISANLATKYATATTYSDRLRQASATETKVLAGPFEKAKLYSEL